MYKFAQLKRFCHGCRLQLYMYVFMYVDPETMPVEVHFPATKTFVVDYNKMSTQGRVPKHWIIFGYMCSED